MNRVPSLGTSKKPQLHECDVSHGVLFPFSSSAKTLNPTRFLEEMVFLRVASLQTRKVEPGPSGGCSVVTASVPRSVH